MTKYFIDLWMVGCSLERSLAHAVHACAHAFSHSYVCPATFPLEFCCALYRINSHSLCSCVVIVMVILVVAEVVAVAVLSLVEMGIQILVVAAVVVALVVGVVVVALLVVFILVFVVVCSRGRCSCSCGCSSGTCSGGSVLVVVYYIYIYVAHWSSACPGPLTRWAFRGRSPRSINLSRREATTTLWWRPHQPSHIRRRLGACEQ